MHDVQCLGMLVSIRWDLRDAGIDMSNIVEGGRRSRARVDYSAVMKPSYEELSEDSAEVGPEPRSVPETPQCTQVPAFIP